MALTVLMHCATPATAAVRRCARQCKRFVEDKPELSDHLVVPDWEALCEHVTVRISRLPFVPSSFVFPTVALNIEFS